MSAWTISALTFAVLFLLSTLIARRAVYIVWTGASVVFRPLLYKVCVIAQWITLAGLIVSIIVGAARS